MPKEKNQAQEVSEVQASETEYSEQESTQESTQTEQAGSEKGFFAKAVDKAKETANELFSTDSSQEEEQTKPTLVALNLKNILKRDVKFASVTAFVYKGEGEFVLKIGAYPYKIASGEAVIVPDDKTAQYLRYKEQLFSEITQ